MKIMYIFAAHYHRMTETIITAVLAFTSTNVDDLFILMMLFTATTKWFRPSHILSGQYMGIITLIAISIMGSLIGIVIPKVYIGLLGFFPIYLGIRKLFDKNDTDDDSPVIIPDKKHILSSVISPATLSVASITIANGADNIGIYIPLFVNLSAANLMFTICIFLIMVFAWVKTAEYLVQHPRLKNTVARYNYVLFPCILIGLGIYILIESKSYTLAFSKCQPYTLYGSCQCNISTYIVSFATPPSTRNALPLLPDESGLAIDRLLYILFPVIISVSNRCKSIFSSLPVPFNNKLTFVLR